MTTLHTTKHKGFTIEIVHDEDGWACDPRDWSNLGVLCLHRRNYTLPNEGHIPFDSLDNRDEVEAYVQENFEVVGPILWVASTEHSGVSYYIGSPRDPWDSGYVGVVFATKQTVADIGVAEADIETVLRQEIETFSAWANGEVYGYVVEDGFGTTIASCFGFIGEDEDAIEQAKAEIDAHVRSLNAEIDRWAALG